MYMEVKESINQNKVELFRNLYQEAFPAACRFVRKMGGNLDDARDIFQDALVIFYEKRADAPGQQISNHTHYVLGICRHLWFRKHKQSIRLSPLEELGDLESGNEEPNISRNLLAYVESAGKKCMELLKAFYYDKQNMKEIASGFGFSGERSATSQKFKCLEKVRNSIREKSLVKEDFYE